MFVSLDEHPRLPAHLAEVTATDPDPGDTVTYSLGGVDAQRFFLGSLTPGRQFLLFRDSPDFENPDDENGDNVYVVTVTATDGTTSVSKTYMVTVRDVDEPPGRPGAPTFGLPAETSIEVRWSEVENTGPPVTYDLRYRAGTRGSWRDGPRGVTGTLATLRNLSRGASYQVQVRAVNDEGTSGWSPSATGMTNAAPRWLSVSTVRQCSFEEGGSSRVTVCTARVRDPDRTDLHPRLRPRYTLTGPDADRFWIVGSHISGTVQFRKIPSCDDPEDADGDNVYEFTVVVTTGRGDRALSTPPLDYAVTVIRQGADPSDGPCGSPAPPPPPQSPPTAPPSSPPSSSPPPSPAPDPLPGTVPEIVWSGGFVETAANDGSVTGRVTATITGDTFVAASGLRQQPEVRGLSYPNAIGGPAALVRGVTTANVPDGLTPRFSLEDGGRTFVLTLDGRARAHADADDVNDLTVAFGDAAFLNSIASRVVRSRNDMLPVESRQNF